MKISVMQESQSSDFSSTLNIRPYAKPPEGKVFFLSALFFILHVKL